MTMTEAYAESIQVLDTLMARLTRLWWRFESLFERWRVHMSPDVRVDTDYNPGDDDMRMLLKGVHRLLERQAGNNYYEGNRGDESGVKKIQVGVGIAVIAAGILGGWRISEQVSSMNATMVAGFNEQNRRFAEQSDRISRLEIKTERMKRDEP